MPPRNLRDEHFKEILKKFKRSKALFFHKEVTKSMAVELSRGPTYCYSMEFPLEFVRKYGEEFNDRPTFKTNKSNKVWPMMVTVKGPEGTRRVFVYGGWKRFSVDNQLKVGDLLVFTLTEFSHFVVYVYRNRPTVKADPDAELQLRASKKLRASKEPTHCTRCHACGQAIQ